VQADEHSSLCIIDRRVSIGQVFETAGRATQVLDHNPVRIAHASSLIDPLLVRVRQRSYVSTVRHDWFVDRFPDDLVVSAHELLNDRTPIPQPAANARRVRQVVVAVIVDYDPETILSGDCYCSVQPGGVVRAHSLGAGTGRLKADTDGVESPGL